jgi:hypothetical protein
MTHSSANKANNSRAIRIEGKNQTPSVIIGRQKSTPSSPEKWQGWSIALQERTICSTLQEWTRSQWSTLKAKATTRWSESQNWWAHVGDNDMKKKVDGMSKNAAFTTLKVSTPSLFGLICTDKVHDFSIMKAMTACWIVSMCYEFSVIRHKEIIATAVKLLRLFVCGIPRCNSGRAIRSLCMRCLSLCVNVSSISAAASILLSCVALFCGFLHIWCEWNEHHFATITLVVSSAYVLYASLEALNPIMRTDCHRASLPSSTSGSVLENGSDLENGGRRGTTIGLPLSNILVGAAGAS